MTIVVELATKSTTKTVTVKNNNDNSDNKNLLSLFISFVHVVNSTLFHWAWLIRETLITHRITQAKVCTNQPPVSIWRWSLARIDVEINLCYLLASKDLKKPWQSHQSHINYLTLLAWHPQILFNLLLLKHPLASSIIVRGGHFGKEPQYKKYDIFI